MALQAAYSETLTKVGLKYMQDPANFKASKIFPACPVNLQSSQYPTYDKEYWMKNEAAIRLPGTESHGSRHGRGFDSYSTQEIAFHEDVDWEQQRNDPNPLNPMRAATRRVTSKIAIFDEVDFATRFLTTGVWTDVAAPTTKWDAANSTPLKDVDGWKRTMHVATGQKVNKMVVSEKVHDVLKRHANIQGNIRFEASALTGAAVSNVSEALMAAIFEVDQYVVMGAVYDSAAYGATAAQSYIAGDKVLLLHTGASPSLEEPSAGYNFKWQNAPGGQGTEGFTVRELEMERIKSDRVEASSYHQMKKVAADLGIFVDAPLT